MGSLDESHKALLASWIGDTDVDRREYCAHVMRAVENMKEEIELMKKDAAPQHNDNVDDEEKMWDGMVSTLESTMDGYCLEVDLNTERAKRSLWNSMTVASLREALRTRGLKVDGKKSELVALLVEAGGQDFSFADAVESAPPPDNDGPDAEYDYDKMTVAQLKDVLRSRGLKCSGNKSTLIERLRSS